VEYIRVAKARASSIFIPPQEATCELSTNIEVPEDFKVEDVTILHHGQPRVGTLYLTPHHLICRIDPEAESSSQSASRTPPPQTKPVKRPREIWITSYCFYTLSASRECRFTGPLAATESRFLLPYFPVQDGAGVQRCFGVNQSSCNCQRGRKPLCLLLRPRLH